MSPPVNARVFTLAADAVEAPLRVVLPRSFIESLHRMLWDEVREHAAWVDVLDRVAELRRQAK